MHLLCTISVNPGVHRDVCEIRDDFKADGIEAAILCPSACGCVQDCEGVWGGLKALDGSGRCACRPELDHCGVCDTDFSNDNACCPPDDRTNGCFVRVCGCVQDCEGVWGGPKTLDSCGVCDAGHGVCDVAHATSCVKSHTT